MRRTALVLALSAACLGCGGASAGPEAPGGEAGAGGEERGGAGRSLLERLGGVDFVRGLVDELMLRVAADGRINQFFEWVDIGAFKEKLAAKICASAGGPCVYGGAGMDEAHAGLGISEAHFDAMLEHVAAALKARGAPVDASRELLDRLGAMKSDIVAR